MSYTSTHIPAIARQRARSSPWRERSSLSLNSAVSGPIGPFSGGGGGIASVGRAQGERKGSRGRRPGRRAASSEGRACDSASGRGSRVRATLGLQVQSGVAVAWGRGPPVLPELSVHHRRLMGRRARASGSARELRWGPPSCCGTSTHPAGAASCEGYR